MPRDFVLSIGSRLSNAKLIFLNFYPISYKAFSFTSAIILI